MFRDHDQASRAIALLLASGGLSALWSDAGPAPAVLLRYQDDLSLPAEKRTLLLAALCLWTPAAAGITLGDVVRDLDLASSTALCSLIVAYKGGADAVDDWIVAAARTTRRAADGDDRRVVPALAEGPTPEGPLHDDWPTLDVLSVRYINRVLDRVKNNKTRAADMLGVDRRTVGRLVAAARRGVVPLMQTQKRRLLRPMGGRGRGG
jgi:hypothetical protein